jgi:asparagine synthase (glutamine-hydrolysing)
MDDSVRLRLVSDVPLGAFLSGGVDSSAIVAAMRRHTEGDLIAYAVGFRGQDQQYEFAPDDLRFSRLMASRIENLDYHEIILEPKVGELLPKIVWHMDEPVADAAAISTYLICKAAKERATVMLSGVGAEEVFAGYRRHHAVLLAEDFVRWPSVVRQGVRTLSNALPGGAPGPGLSLRRNLQKFTASAELPFEKRYFGYCGYYTAEELRAVVTRSLPTEDVLVEHERHLARAGSRSPLNRLLYVDLKTFLPCLNLTYTDKAAMAASVEVRVPVLDYRIVELAATMRQSLKVRGSRQKWVFKQAVSPWVPAEVVRRPKTGFGGPTRSWVKNDLRPMVDDLLSEDSLRKRGLLNPAEVRRLLVEDREGRRDHAYKIWTFVTLELWMRVFLDGNGAGG